MLYRKDAEKKIIYSFFMIIDKAMWINIGSINTTQFYNYFIYFRNYSDLQNNPTFCQIVKCGNENEKLFRLPYGATFFNCLIYVLYVVENNDNVSGCYFLNSLI
jgi:hypothetical protein